jgi:hypothetical protein
MQLEYRQWHGTYGRVHAHDMYTVRYTIPVKVLLARRLQQIVPQADGCSLVPLLLPRSALQRVATQHSAAQRCDNAACDTEYKKQPATQGRTHTP